MGSYGTSFPCDSDTPGPTGQYVADRPVDLCVHVGPVGLCGSSSLSMILVDSGGTFPSFDVAVRWDPTILAESASLRGPGGPVMPMRTFPQSDQGGGECMDMHGGWSGPNVAGEIIDGVTVYYGDSEESDWGIRRMSLVKNMFDDYNFDLLEGIEPMVFVPGGNPSRSNRQDEYKTYLYDGNDARVPDDDSIVDRERRT